MSSKRTIKIAIERTVQVVQFEPIKVMVEESMQVDEEDMEEARNELYTSVSEAVETYVRKEVKKWRKLRKEENAK